MPYRSLPPGRAGRLRARDTSITAPRLEPGPWRGRSWRKVGVAIGHAGHAVGGAHGLQVVEVTGGPPGRRRWGSSPVRVSALAAVEEGSCRRRRQGWRRTARRTERWKGCVSYVCLGDGVPCRPACPGGLGARRKALCKPISKKAHTCACSGGWRILTSGRTLVIMSRIIIT